MENTLEERFWAKVNKNGAVVREELGPCWEWTGKIKCGKSGGYGVISYADYSSDRRSKRRFNRKEMKVHRLSYKIHFGQIEEGLFICHKCDNRKCVRPSHLFAGTQKENLQDMANKNRSTYGERSARAKLTKEQVREIREIHTAGTLIQKEIAILFSVSKTQVYKIVRNLRWNKVQ